MKKIGSVLIVLIIAGLLFGTLVGCGAKKEAPAKTAEKAEQPAKKLKAGFIYIGPVGDYGWSNAHDVGRKYAQSKLPWLETVIVESVP